MPGPTNHPVRKLGRIALRRLPIAHLDDVEADAQLSLERDLRQAPTPISGGMRKALKKETDAQDGLRRRTPRAFRRADLLRTYDLVLADCPHCRHQMFFDEIAFDDLPELRCDRCKRPVW